MIKIKFKAEEYPISINMTVIDEWESVNKMQMSQMGEFMKGNSEIKGIIKILELAYLGVKDACLDNNIPFEFTENEFIKGFKVHEAKEVMAIVMREITGQNIEDLEKFVLENKGLPKKTKSR